VGVLPLWTVGVASRRCGPRGLLCGGLGVFGLNLCFDGQPFGVVPQTADFVGKTSGGFLWKPISALTNQSIVFLLV
jgi:hypothetical protein